MPGGLDWADHRALIGRVCLCASMMYTGWCLAAPPALALAWGVGSGVAAENARAGPGEGPGWLALGACLLMVEVEAWGEAEGGSGCPPSPPAGLHMPGRSGAGAGCEACGSAG